MQGCWPKKKGGVPPAEIIGGERAEINRMQKEKRSANVQSQGKKVEIIRKTKSRKRLCYLAMWGDPGRSWTKKKGSLNLQRYQRIITMRVGGWGKRKRVMTSENPIFTKPFRKEDLGV